MDDPTILSTLEPVWSDEPGSGTLGAKHPTVLVVEDEALVAKDIARTLTELGYRVTGCVASASAALCALDKTQPDLVVSDIRLKGGLDGIQLAATVKERFGLPVVFLSSHADESTLARATATNPYGFVMKPFRVRELHAGLELALRRHSLDTRLKQESVTDALTGLYNRRGFELLGEQQLKAAARGGSKPALLMVDLNGMKAVNDTYGHEAGDQLLLDAAKVLRNTFRDSDIMARLGGDEFVVLALEPSDGSVEIMERRIRANLERLNAEAGRRYRLSMSIGARTWNPALHRTLSDLLAEADAKMYEAKLGAKKRGSGPMVAVRKSRCAPPEAVDNDFFSGLVRMLELREPAQASHSRLVARYSRVIAEALGYDVESARALGRAALLHDVGDMVVPEELLANRRTGESDPVELLALHTLRGAEVLRGTKDDLLARAAVIALGHHERWDGAGYPGNLRGEECPLDARIVATADAYDQLARRGSSDEALTFHFTREAGVRFDPAVAAAVIKALPILRRVGADDCATTQPPVAPSE